MSPYGYIVSVIFSIRDWSNVLYTYFPLCYTKINERDFYLIRINAYATPTMCDCFAVYIFSVSLVAASDGQHWPILSSPPKCLLALPCPAPPPTPLPRVTVRSCRHTQSPSIHSACQSQSKPHISILSNLI